MSNSFRAKNLNNKKFSNKNNNNNEENFDNFHYNINTNDSKKFEKSPDNSYRKNLIAQYINQQKEIEYLRLKLSNQNKMQNQIRYLKTKIKELNNLLESKNETLSSFEELTNISKQKLEFLKYNNQIKNIEITESVKHLKNLNFNKNILLNSLENIKSSNKNLKIKIREQSNDKDNSFKSYKTQLNNFNYSENLKNQISNYENEEIFDDIEKEKNKLANLNKKLKQKNNYLMEIDDCNNRMISEIETLNKNYQEVCINIDNIKNKIQTYNDICNKYENNFRKKRLLGIYKNNLSMNTSRNNHNILSYSYCNDKKNITKMRNNYFPLNISNNYHNRSFFNDSY